MGPEADRILEDGVASVGPPRGAKARGWRALQERLEPPAPARPRWVVPVSIAIAIAAAVVLLWSLAGTRTTVADRSAHEQAADHAAIPTPAPATIPAPAPAPAIVPVAPPPELAAPREAVPIQRPRAAATPTTDPLADESALLAEGQRALANRPQLALDRARAHRKRFPAGALAEDAGALEIAALCRLGRTDEAATAAAALHRRLPDSAVASTLAERPCRE
jgi:hypothetical protein